MFMTHQKKIGKACKKNPKDTEQYLILPLLSIQRHFYTMPSMLDEVEKSGARAKCLRGFKKKGYQYIKKNYIKLHGVIFSNDLTDAEKLVELLAIPNIGIVKAGFILQLCIGRVGCLDTHNLSKYGVDPNEFKVGKPFKYETALKKAEKYVDLCLEIGGCEYLWNQWCDDMALRYPTKYKNGNHVSRVHDTYISSRAA
mgnify:CR=1 FL=1|tara:strand:- start:57 stop:650 length:594 start_codon:yes stop_codon:yes gene_type:complete